MPLKITFVWFTCCLSCMLDPDKTSIWKVCEPSVTLQNRYTGTWCNQLTFYTLPVMKIVLTCLSTSACCCAKAGIKKSLKQIITSSKKKQKNTSVTFDCMKESCLLLTAAAGYKTNVTVDSTHPRTCGQKSAQGDTDREVSLMISGTDICPFSPQSNFFV